MAVRVVTDSTCDLPPETVAQLGITVIPLTVLFGDEALQDGIDIDATTFYDRLAAAPDLPKTSQPSVEAFLAVYRAIAAEGHEIVSIHISSRLSGTLNSASVARETGDLDARVELIDSYTVSMGLGVAVVAAAERAQQGGSLEEVAAAAQSGMERAHVVVALDTLEYLRRGGRIGRAGAFLGSALRIKPIVHLDGGEVAPLERVRTHARAIRRIEEIATEDRTIEALHVVWTADDAAAAALLERVRPLLPHTQLEVGHIGPTVGTYVGPNATGICTVRRER